MDANKQSRNANWQVVWYPHPWPVPWPDGWRRQIYERIISLAWPLVIGPLIPHGRTHSAYLTDEVTSRLRPVAEHLASAEVSLGDQVRFLDAFFSDAPDDWREDVGDSFPRTGNLVTVSRTAPTSHVRIVREYFIQNLERVLTVAFDHQSDYELSLGMPLRQEPHLLASPNGERLWAEHLELRRGKLGSGTSTE